MTNEKWQNLIFMIEEKFGILEKETKDSLIEDDIGNKVKGTRDMVIFENEMGKIKLERENRPMIVDKKMHYHKTAGTGAKVEYIVSDTEMVHKVTAYKWNEASDDWEELKLPGGRINF